MGRNFESVHMYTTALKNIMTIVSMSVVISVAPSTVPYVLLITSCLSLWICDSMITNALPYWIAWILYGHMWSCDPIDQFYKSVCTSFMWVLIGLKTVSSRGKTTMTMNGKVKQVMFFILLLFPYNIWTLWTFSDLILHVVVFLVTFYFYHYTTIYLDWNTNEYEQEHETDDPCWFLSSVWILFVSKWFVPFIGITWMYLAYEISGKLSAKEGPSSRSPSPSSSLSPSPPPLQPPLQKKKPSSSSSSRSEQSSLFSKFHTHSSSNSNSKTNSRKPAPPQKKFRRNYNNYRQQSHPKTGIEALMAKAHHIETV